MRRIHAVHHTACRVLLEKKFPKVFRQVWSWLFLIMPSRCVAAGCSNTTKDGVSLHRFPSDPKYRRIWTTKVKLTRAKWSGPTEHSFLCSAHFEQTCFERGLHSQWSVVAERSSLPDSSSGVSSRMWVRIPAVTLVSLSKTLNHNCFSPHALNGAFTASSVWLIRPCCYQMQFQRYSH